MPIIEWQILTDRLLHVRVARHGTTGKRAAELHQA